MRPPPPSFLFRCTKRSSKDLRSTVFFFLSPFCNSFARRRPFLPKHIAVKIRLPFSFRLLKMRNGLNDVFFPLPILGQPGSTLPSPPSESRYGTLFFFLDSTLTRNISPFSPGLPFPDSYDRMIRPPLVCNSVRKSTSLSLPTDANKTSLACFSCLFFSLFEVSSLTPFPMEARDVFFFFPPLAFNKSAQLIWM